MVSRLTPQSSQMMTKVSTSSSFASVSDMQVDEDEDCSPPTSPSAHGHSHSKNNLVEQVLIAARDALSDATEEHDAELEKCVLSVQSSPSVHSPSRCCLSPQSAAADSGLEESSYSDSTKHRHMSLLKLFALNSTVFAYGLIVATMGLIVLPLESTRLFPEDHAFMMGAMLAVTGVSQLVCPIAGYLSDRTVSRLGRRRPYILAGAIIGVSGLGALYACRQYLLSYLYMLSLFVATLGLNFMYSGYTALLPDLVHHSQNGVASGVMGVMGMVGSCLGFVLFGFYFDPVYAYGIYAMAIVAAGVLTCVVAKEEPLVTARPILRAEILRSFWIDRSTHEDFFWVFIIRTLYYMATSIQAFILFYLRDVLHASDPAHSTSLLAMYGQVAAAVVALPAGSLSQRTGRKLLVTVSCVMMSVVYLVFCVIDSLQVVLLMGLVYGTGNGVFLAVDYALALDTLPADGTDTARDLGVWGVAAFLGSTLGGAIGGAILNFVGAPEEKAGALAGESAIASLSGQSEGYYTFRGYLALLLSGIGYLSLAIVLLPRIKNARRLLKLNLND
eukprot:g72989.t1